MPPGQPAMPARCDLLFREATVMDGVPIFSMFPLGLPATVLRGFSGGA